MERFSLDIFESDRAFITFVGSVLVGMGLPLFLLGISCKVVEWGYCQVQVVPLFGGIQEFRPDITNIILPMAMLIIGISIRLYSVFGWLISIFTLVMLNVLFIRMAWWLHVNLPDYLLLAVQQDAAVTDYPYIESLIMNSCFSILTFGGLVYLILPSVRKKFWRIGITGDNPKSIDH